MSQNAENQLLSLVNSLGQALQPAAAASASTFLQKISKSPNFIELLLKVPLIPNVPHSVALLSTTYVKVYAKTIITPFKQQQVSHVLQSLVNFLSQSKIQYKMKENLVEGFRYLIQNDRSKLMNKQYQQKIIEYLKKCTELQVEHYEFLSLICNPIIETIVKPFSQHTQFLQLMCDYLLTLIFNLSNLVQKASNAELNQIILYLSKFSNSLCLCLQKLGSNSSVYLSAKLKPTINACLNVNLPNNRSQFPMFYTNAQQDRTQSDLETFHQMKKNIVKVIELCLQCAFKKQNHDAQIVLQCSSFIPVFIKCVGQASLRNLNISQLFLIQQIYSLLTILIKVNKFYKIFAQNKTSLIYGCLLRTLSFNSEDENNFKDNSQQFINSFYYILAKYDIKNDDEQKSNQQQNQSGVQKMENETKQNYNDFHEQDQQKQKSIKQTAADLLINYLQNIDGSTIELLMFCLTILNSPNPQSVYRKDTVILVVCLIKKLVNQNNNLKFKIGQVLISGLGCRELPSTISIATSQTQYCMLLLAFNTYLPLIHQFVQEIVESLLMIVQQIIMGQNVPQTIQLAASYLMLSLLQTEEGSDNADKVLALVSVTLDPLKVNLKYLKCIQLVVKECGQNFVSNLKPVQRIVKKVGQLILSYVQANQQGKQISVISKLWAILYEVSDSRSLMPDIKGVVHMTIKPLLQLICDENEYTVSEPVFQVLCCLMKRSAIINQFQVQMFELLRNNFYNGYNKGSMTATFSYFQHFIFYGAPQLLNEQAAVKNLLKVCCDSITEQTINQCPRSESDYCEGVLTMQSIMIALAQTFDKDMWLACLKCNYDKMVKQTIVYDFFKAALKTNMALILLFAHKFLSEEEVTQLLTLVLKDCYVFTYKNSAKLFTIAIVQLLELANAPFVRQKYAQILECAVTMLKMIQQGKDKVLQNQDLDSEQTQYFKLESMVLNSFAELDEFTLFKNVAQTTKSQNPQLFQNAFSRLSQNKKQYMKDIVSVRKVKNQIRTIYKMKPKVVEKSEMSLN